MFEFGEQTCGHHVELPASDGECRRAGGGDAGPVEAVVLMRGFIRESLKVGADPGQGIGEGAEPVELGMPGLSAGQAR